MLAAGWKEGWSEEYGRRYYYNEMLGCTQWHPPEALYAATASSTKDIAEAAIASALGFVDPIVHAVAAKILADECDHATAVERLCRHLPDVDAAACARAILARAAPCDSGNDSAESSDAEASAVGPGDSLALAPWERASASTAHCVEKAELVAALARSDTTRGDGGCSSTAGGSGCGVLHDEIAAFAEWARPQTAELRARSAIKRLIARTLQTLAADTTLEPYGSSTYTGGAGGRERLGLFNSDLDLAMAPPHALKPVATLLSDARDVGGRRAFVDVDVLSARVPIVCAQHVRSGIEIDISASDRGGGDSGGGGSEAVKALMCGALARHPQLASLAAVLKSLLVQRGLHEPYTGGLGSTKLYVLLTAWLDAPPRRSRDLGQCLQAFLEEHARRLPTFITAGDVEADLSAVRIPDCTKAFGEAAAALQARGQLRAVLDVRAMVGARQRSLRKAEAYTAALLADAKGAAGATDTASDTKFGGAAAKRQRAS